MTPLALTGNAHAWDAPAQNDCNHAYVAITKRPAPNQDFVGYDLRDADDLDFPGGGGGE